jgi:hypothetical protein
LVLLPKGQDSPARSAWNNNVWPKQSKLKNVSLPRSPLGIVPRLKVSLPRRQLKLRLKRL